MRNEDFEYLLIKYLFHLPEKSILSQSLPLPQHQVQHQFYQLLMTQVPLDLVQFLSGPRAESAGAVTGRRCPHSGRGEDFLSRQPHFFTETAVTPKRKVEKSFPRWEINRHVEG